MNGDNPQISGLQCSPFDELRTNGLIRDSLAPDSRLETPG
jgi:hypothetical protein